MLLSLNIAASMSWITTLRNKHKQKAKGDNISTQDVVPEQPLAPASQLCTKCQALRDAVASRLYETSVGKVSMGSSSVQVGDVWYFSFPSLRQLQRNNCDLCQFFRLSLLGRLAILDEPFPPFHRRGSLRIRFHRIGERERPGGHFMMDGEVRRSVTSFQEGKMIKGVSWDVFSHDETICSSLGITKPPSTTAWSSETLTFAKAALAECVSSCPKQVTTWMPTRLLDIGDGSDQNPIKLVLSKNLGTTSVKYAALSYCWGTKREAKTQLKTTISSLPTHLRHIPHSSLTSVMQDAVKVCRALSIRYLWIDSLCILQGQSHDPEQISDWEREKNMMGLVFSSAWVTICAANSTSCHQSFLDRSLVQTTLGLTFPEDTPLAGTHTCTLVQQQVATAPNPSPDNRPLTIDLHGSRWSDRGWVFQERQMSTRMLIFGSSTVHFQCAWLSMTENGYVERREEPQTLSGVLASLPQSPLSESEDQVQKSLYTSYRKLIQEYRTTSLTYPSDRLPAIQGLISRIGTVVNDRTFHGIWEMDLHYGLLWKTPPPPREDVLYFRDIFAQRSRDYHTRQLGRHVPSWSWLCESHQRRGYHGVDRFKINAGTRLFPKYRDAAIIGEDDTPDPTGSTLRIVAQAKPLCADDRGDVTYTHSALGELHTKHHDRFSYIAHCGFDFTLVDEVEVKEICAKALLLFTASEYRDQDLMLSVPGQYEFEDFLEKPELDETYDREDDYKTIVNRQVDAWGLVIYPIPETNKYIRLGTFTGVSFAQIKGVRMFEGIKYRSYDIV